MKASSKAVLISLLLSALPPARAFANPYFRPNPVFSNPAHPVMIAGALIDPASLKETSGGSLLPVLTHSPSDGCLLPNVVCESWTPLAVGGALSEGKLTLDMGPVANVLPWFQTAALAATPSSWQGLINILTPSAGSSVTFSAGPIWEYSQLANHGYLKVFSGLQLNF